MLDRMLAKDPADRFATPAEVADAVGPFATGSNLAALVARAQGKPAPEPSPTQSMLHTQEIPSLFLGLQAVAAADRGGVGHVAAAIGCRQASLARSRWRSIAGFLGVGLICLVARADSGVSAPAPHGQLAQPAPQPPRHRRRPVSDCREKTYLVLHWPAEERQGATCELDGQAQDMERLDLLAVGGEISLPVTPGEHKLVIKRLGYEPFEQSFTVTPRQGRSDPADVEGAGHGGPAALGCAPWRPGVLAWPCVT